MNEINKKFLNGIIGGFGLGSGAVFLIAGVHISGVVASVIGVVMVYLGFRMRDGGTEATIKAIKALEDKRQRRIAEGAK